MKWIDVKDELPELYPVSDYYAHSHRVLVIDNGAPMVAILENDHKCTMFVNADTYSPLRDVTHWAPIYLPKEEKGNE